MEGELAQNTTRVYNLPKRQFEKVLGHQPGVYVDGVRLPAFWIPDPNAHATWDNLDMFFVWFMVYRPLMSVRYQPHGRTRISRKTARLHLVALLHLRNEQIKQQRFPDDAE